MSKAKELAREVEDLYSRSKIWDMNIDSDITDIVYLSVDLCRAVLSEPEPLKGWIEIGEKPYRKLISTTTERIYREGSYRHNGSGFQSNPNEIHMLLDAGKDYENLEISYEEIKRKIKEAS